MSVRKLLTADEARTAFSTFDVWTARETAREQITAPNIASAAAFIRRLDVALRTPDAIHVAAAQRIDAELLTFDEQMVARARALGVAVALG